MTTYAIGNLPSETVRQTPIQRQRALLLLVVLAGILCRVGQYMANPSLWHDEALVALNVMDRPAGQLLGPLDFAQAAPPLFLLAERGVWVATGNPDYALRLLSFVCGIAALPLFALLCWRLLPGAAAPWTVAFFALSDKLIWHSAEVKPYSADVLCAVVLLLLALAIRRGSAVLRFARLSVVAAVLIWLSFPAAVMFGGMSLTLLPRLWKRGKFARAVWVLGNALVAASFLALYFLTVRHQQGESGNYLMNYWRDDFPDYSHPSSIPYWLASELLRFCDHPYRSFGYLIGLLGVLGIVGLARRRRYELLGACVWPIGLAILAAFAGQYPFNGDRLTVYLVPGLFLLCGAGTAWLRESLPLPWQKLWFALALVIVGRGTVEGAWRLYHPRSRSNIRPIVEYIRQTRRPDEGLYLVGETLGASTQVPQDFTGGLSRELLCYWRNPENCHLGLPRDVTRIPEQRFWVVLPMLPEHNPDKALEPLVGRLRRVATLKVRKLPDNQRGGAALLFERNDASGS